MIFFKSKGYLIKRGIMDPSLMKKARDRFWDNAPACLKQDDPSTWPGPLPEEHQSKDEGNWRNEYHWKYRRLNNEPWFIKMIATQPEIFHIAEDLLGVNQLAVPEKARGVYGVLPYGNRPRPAVRCHCDGHAFHLGVVGIIEDVKPDGGGFCVWPGSHKKFYHTFTSGYLADTNKSHSIIMEEVNEEMPTECLGLAGDVIFWHHRLGHMAGQNYSTQIRQAVLSDFCKKDIEFVKNQLPCSDMWEHWSSELRTL